MTALKGRDIDAFLKRRDEKIAAVLIYGPDAGLVRERADKLAATVVSDFKDPFNYIEFADADLKGEPGRLADEAQALSFAGGARVIRVKGAGDATAKAAEPLLAGLDKGHLKSNALIVIEAGDLAKTSALRKAFEKAKTAAALPCYADGPADVRALAGKLREAERWKQRAHVEAISDQYDRAHAAAHGALADCFRRRVTTDAISVALLGRRSHPYR